MHIPGYLHVPLFLLGQNVLFNKCEETLFLLSLKKQTQKRGNLVYKVSHVHGKIRERVALPLQALIA